MSATELGFGSYVNSARLNTVKVGRFTSIGYDALVGLGTHPTDRFSTYPGFYNPNDPSKVRWASEPTFQENSILEVGSDVWIGARAIILGGLSIGDGSIIAAGSVVTRSIPPYSIAGGIPARIIRSRASAPTVDIMMKIKWWNFSVAQLRNCSDLISTPLNEELARTLADRLSVQL